MERVEMLPAFVWFCNNCGAENPERMIEATAADRREFEQYFRDDNGLEDFEPLPDDVSSMVLHASPKTVKCRDCKTAYLTSDPNRSKSYAVHDRGHDSEIEWLRDGETAVGTALGRVFIVREDDEGFFWPEVVGGKRFETSFSDQEEAMDFCQNWLDNL